MDSILSALIPVFAVMALGHILRRLGLAPAEAMAGLDRINYFVLFPALLFHTLATAELGGIALGPMAAALIAAIFTMLPLLMILRRVLKLEGPQYSSVFQGTLRWNGFVALAALANLFGDEGVALAAVGLAALVPLLNLLSVWVLTRNGPPAQNGDSTAPSLIGTLAILWRNPLILSCVAGMLWNASPFYMPQVVSLSLDVLGQAALGLGLLSVGAGLDLNAARRTRGLVAMTSALKLIVLPLIIALWCAVFGLTGIERTVAILIGTVPTASSAYILSRQLGGDAILMASLLAGSTLGAIVTMPIAAYLVL